MGKIKNYLPTIFIKFRNTAVTSHKDPGYYQLSRSNLRLRSMCNSNITCVHGYEFGLNVCYCNISTKESSTTS